MIAEARRRIAFNKQRTHVKQMLNEKQTRPATARGGTVRTRDLMWAAKMANFDINPALLAATKFAAKVDDVGAPTRVLWKPFISQLPPPELKGPGGFGPLPPLRRIRAAAAAQVAATPTTVEATPEPVAVRPKASDKDFVHWFGVLQSKMKDRFTEVRRAFRLLDEDFSGCLSVTEFKKVLAMFNLDHVPDAVFERILDLVDEDGDRTIKFAEFASLVSIEPNQLLARCKAERS